MRVGAQLEDPWLALDQTEGARADRQRAVGRCDASKRVLAPDDRKLEVREEGGVRLTEDEDDRPRVGHSHLSDPAIGMRVAASETRIDDALEGGHHVSCVQGAAVAEAQPVTEPHLEPRRARRSHRLRQVRNHVECPRIDRHQRSKEKPRDAQAIGVTHKAGVELFCITGEHHDQSVRVVNPGLRAAKADH